ncbi:helix-turn-helix domain-containing protein [Pseudonocardia parietis]|uniref:Transcriptional regulator with XRE-family HTH domain n=1 Tax=Pseudonocardia parietis TaxID=570936 RepID=A0ABS4W1A0_9PSEU|nr:helix-turn-helix transcriptional regulator [Pseudonocardia parietis]MBP2369987.1 transcriptional regulator with XRE-family HTH domain [Pseudonocardia parietis]
MLLREAIGSGLRQARTARRRTLRDISRAARVSLGYLSEVERGRKEPSSELLASICEALGVTVPDLLTSVAVEMASATDAALRTRDDVLVPIGQRHAELRLAGRPGSPVTAPASSGGPVASAA